MRVVTVYTLTAMRINKQVLITLNAARIVSSTSSVAIRSAVLSNALSILSSVGSMLVPSLSIVECECLSWRAIPKLDVPESAHSLVGS